ncbi:MAG: hypothetical protein V7K98_08415 [Nostoc sp.]
MRKVRKLVKVFAIASEIIFNALESLSIAQSDGDCTAYIEYIYN